MALSGIQKADDLSKKTLKKLWNEKKMKLKQGKIKEAVSLNDEILKRIGEEK